MKTNTANILARLRLPGTAAPATPSHDTPNVMQPPKPLRRMLTGLAPALAVFALAATGTALADKITDESFTDTSQIRSATNNPYFGALTENVAALNVTWYQNTGIAPGQDQEAGYGAYAGGTLNGIGFHNILLGTGSAVHTGDPVDNALAGVTMDYNLDGGSVRNMNYTVITGTDAAVAYNVSASNWYRAGADITTITLHGLTPNNDVYVQLIGGEHGWNATPSVSLNGGTAVAWDSIKSTVKTGNPALLGITGTTDASGDLLITMTGPNYYGLAAITVAQKLPVGSTATTTALTRISGSTPSTYGDELSFEVTVSGTPGIPSGTVTLKDGETLISDPVGLDELGKCTITTSTLAVGTYSIVAVYGGDPTFASSTSTPGLTQAVTPASSTVTVTGATSFTYTGTPQGPSTADKTGSSGDVTFEYVGVDPTAYELSATRPTAIGTYTCTATLPADANHTGAVSAPFAFAIVVGSPPDNDNFAAAIELTPASGGTQTGTDNIDASAETGEPNSANYHTVWFKWTAAEDGYFSINTVGSTDPDLNEWDALLAIYTGSSVDALTTVVVSPDTNNAETITNLPVTAETTYYIQLAGFGNGVAENIILNWSFTSTAYSVTYNGNGSDDDLNAPVDPSSPYPSGTTVTVLGKGALVKSGYAFAGWNTQADGGGTSYAPAATFPITADTTLYAKWEAIPTFTVTYDGNGGDGGTAPVDSSSPYFAGTTVTVLGQGDLVQTGYSFTRWNTAADGTGTSYNPADTFSITADTTLYAQWALPPTPVTVTDIQWAGTGTHYGVSATDLIDASQTTTFSSIDLTSGTAMYGSSVNMLNDGSEGGGATANTGPSLVPQDGTVVTVVLNTSENTAGYDINRIVSLTGEADGTDRISQKYDVEYHVVGGGWTGLAGDSGATVARSFTSTTDGQYVGELQVTISGMILTGVDQLRFTFHDNPSQAAYREIDVFGLPTGGVVPTHTLTYTAGPNGSIAGVSPQTVADGTNGSMVTAVPDSGYRFVAWSDNRSTVAERTDTVVIADITTTALFVSNAELISNGSFEIGKDIADATNQGPPTYAAGYTSVSLPGTDLPWWNGTFTAWYLSRSRQRHRHGRGSRRRKGCEFDRSNGYGPPLTKFCANRRDQIHRELLREKAGCRWHYGHDT